ncbi:MAG: hypothetical protein EG828_04795 [Deltaproteobacteria bacterium]|nr:hypothetical protein [Deltaproteobacteria bacterium]
MQITAIIKHQAKSITFVLAIFVIGSCLLPSNSFGGNKMECLYDLQEAESLKPQEFELKGGLFDTGFPGGMYAIISLFPVPRDNSVGTSNMNNAITLISFPKGRIKFDKYFKNAVDDLDSGQYMPVIDQDMIGLGQTRSFILYDFKKKIHREYYITKSIANTIERIATGDARKRHFIFEMEKGSTKSPDPWAGSNVLRLVDLSGSEPRIIKEIALGSSVYWSVVNDKNILWDFRAKKVQVYDMNFEPSNHPLANVIKQNKAKLEFVDISVHPTLPFAILGSKVISWGEGRQHTPYSLVEDSRQVSFSPDGKWVAFKYEFGLGNGNTYLMPVSEKYPHYLGSPIQLFNKDFDDGDFAWTSNPTSFVGTRLGKIYRWDLDNHPHPKSEHMSFHDYVVERDLEKLRKEKQQGLGEKDN